jgi:hypothetical protein
VHDVNPACMLIVQGKSVEIERQGCDGKISFTW